MPSAVASTAASAAKSTESRSTPGIDATAVRLFSPSTTKRGQIRSLGESVFSATRARDQGEARNLRMRVAGNWVMA